MQAFGRGGHNQIGKCLVKALHTSAWPSSHSCMLPMGHTHTNASANTGPKSAFQGLKGNKKKKKKKKRERERLMFWSQILSLLENVHSCLVNQRIFWEKN